MKIGILTHWWSNDNYGQQLQCFALQKYLRDAGHEPFLIRYSPGGDIIRPSFYKRLKKLFNPLFLYKFVQRRVAKFFETNKEEYIENNKWRGFERFRKEYILQSEEIYYSWEQLKENPPDAQVYIVGSDQVWNFHKQDVAVHGNNWHVWFLDFGSKDIKKVSYAASWGRNEISQEQIQELQPLLANFNFVSVRELSGVGICKQCGYNTAKWMPDPTLLFGADEYRSLYKGKSPKKLNRDYVFFYWLNKRIQNPYKHVKKWAKENNLEIKYVAANGNDSFPKEYVTVEEWLHLIDSAKYVVTNSYHCCLFAALFHIPFGVFPLKGHYGSTNERMQSLFNTLEIEPRYLEYYDFNILTKKMDFDLIEKNLEKMRKENDFLSELSSL